jgi:ureidoglycolate hydrolase
MDESWLEIRKYGGEGYRPLIDFGTWRVAVLRWIASIEPEQVTYMERHTQTDEVFVLLDGQATLVLGGNSASVIGVFPQELERCQIYNVKQNVWHTILLSQDASILIVEENNTGKANTEYCTLLPEFRKEIIAIG